MKETILLNFVAAAQQAKLKHIFIVVTSATTNIEKDMNVKLLQQVKASGIPFTCILIPSKLIDQSSNGYTYQDGIISKDIKIESVTDEVFMATIESTNDIERDSKSSIYREDVAAICVQAIQSCYWKRPQRYLTVHTPTSSTQAQQRPNNESSSVGIPKRMDQLWCKNADLLEDQLNRVP